MRRVTVHTVLGSRPARLTQWLTQAAGRRAGAAFELKAFHPHDNALTIDFLDFLDFLDRLRAPSACSG